MGLLEFEMNNLKTLLSLGLVIASISAFGQESSQKLMLLPKDPPGQVASAIPIGPKPQADLIHLAVTIKVADPEGLQSFVDSVSNPTSPNYRKFISPDEVGRRFGLPINRVKKIQDYLLSQGMTVSLVAKNRMAILADATVAEAETAFHTKIEQYSVAKQDKLPGGVFYSFTNSPAIPSDIAFDVEDIGGLENINRPMHHGTFTPAQLRTIYTVSTGYNAGYTGKGRTIGISNFGGFAVSNAVTYINTFGLPTPSGGAGSNISVESISGGSQSVQAVGEGDLDIQATIGMAPLCTLIVYDGGENNLPGVLTKESEDNTADIVTESYGWSMSTAAALGVHNLHLSLSAEGITYMAASGDHGTYFGGTSSQAYVYPAIDPEVLSIGGTSVTVNSNNTRKTEVGWNNGWPTYDAGGGGWAPTVDTFNVHPSYQVGTGVPSAASHPYRLTPDISFDADPNTGYYVYATLLYNGAETTGWWDFGGTSAASPNCAGSLADSEQQLIALGTLTADANGHYRMGRLQDLTTILMATLTSSSMSYLEQTGLCPTERPRRQELAGIPIRVGDPLSGPVSLPNTPVWEASLRFQ